MVLQLVVVALVSAIQFVVVVVVTQLSVTLLQDQCLGNLFFLA
jgi:hypothetical protein